MTMNVPLRYVLSIALLASLLVGCAPTDAPNRATPAQPLGPAPVGAPGPTRVYDVAPPPTPAQQAAVLPPTAEPTSPPVGEGAPANPSAWTGKVTILHTNDSVGYLDPCG